METNEERMRTILKRFPILREIQDRESPVSQRDISDNCDVSKSTAYRTVNKLVEEGVLRKEGGGYVLTDLGKVLVDETSNYISRMEAAREMDGFLDVVTETELGVKHLIEGDVTRGSTEKPLAPVRRLVENVERSDSVRFLTNSATVFDSDFSGSVEAVVSESLVESLERGIDALMGEGEARSGSYVWVYEERIPHQMAILDGRLFYGIENESGLTEALLETEEEKAVTWAEDTFEEYREDAVEFGPSEIPSVSEEMGDESVGEKSSS